MVPRNLKRLARAAEKKNQISLARALWQRMVRHVTNVAAGLEP